VPVLADLPLGQEADAGVVDERVEARLGGGDLRGHRAHLGERREVGPVGAQPLRARRLAQLAEGAVEALLAAAVEQDGCAAGREIGGHAPAEAVGGAGDQDDLLGDVAHGAEAICRVEPSR
jgi:hypothetical protein